MGNAGGQFVMEQALEGIGEMLAHGDRLALLGLTTAEVQFMQDCHTTGLAIAEANLIYQDTDPSTLPQDLKDRMASAEAIYIHESGLMLLSKDLVASSVKGRAVVLHELVHAKRLGDPATAEQLADAQAQVNAIAEVSTVAEVDTILQLHVLSMREEYAAHHTEALAVPALRDRRDLGEQNDNLDMYKTMVEESQNVGTRSPSYLARKNDWESSLRSELVNFDAFDIPAYKTAVETFATELGTTPPSLLSYAL